MSNPPHWYYAIGKILVPAARPVLRLIHIATGRHVTFWIWQAKSGFKLIEIGGKVDEIVRFRRHG